MEKLSLMCPFIVRSRISGIKEIEQDLKCKSMVSSEFPVLLFGGNGSTIHSGRMASLDLNFRLSGLAEVDQQFIREGWLHFI